MKSIYLIGSLRNEEIPKIAAELRQRTGLEVFDDWYAAGPEADDYWKAYEVEKGHTYQQALAGYAARNVYQFDRFHLERCDMAVLALPAGKSGHLELGWFLGTGKPGFILLDQKDCRFDVMYQFATGVASDVGELLQFITGVQDTWPQS